MLAGNSAYYQLPLLSSDIDLVVRAVMASPGVGKSGQK
jgi:hypothetical protein